MAAPTIVIGTAGHIDHGKTTLLRALTGIDADRLPEERSRGMTIDVGYAHLAFDDGLELDFVDVPGHDRLIGNMLVGAGEVDGAMLVVAADDGPRPQTLEHLQLLDALGIDAGLAVVTKVDTVDAARADEVARDVAALLARTSLAGAPVLRASGTTGEGIGELRIALRALADRLGVARTPAPGDAPRLAIDRAFAVKGRGAVVTGTLRGGRLAADAALRREPGGEPVRVREVQVHGAPRPAADGGRTALNVVGLPVEQLRRGDVLTSDPAVTASDRLLLDLVPVADLVLTQGRAGRGQRAGARLRLHLGTDQVDATLRRIGARPGSGILDLDRPVATFVGDRGVLREPASGAIVAGCVILDVRPPRGASRRRLDAAGIDRLAAAVRNPRDGTAVRVALDDLHGFRDGALAPDVQANLEAAALAAVAAQHRDAPLSAGLPLLRARTTLLRRLRSMATVERSATDRAGAAITALLDQLVADGRLARSGDALHDPARGAERPAGLVAAMDRLEQALDVPAPPSLDAAAAAAGCPPEGVRALQAEARIVRLAPDLAWSTAMYHRLAALALERAREAPLTPAAFRDATGTSRKYVLTILEDLDRRGILARTPEGHIPGPRAPQAAPE
jgi:selenocysteine-specific elongation factor